MYCTFGVLYIYIRLLFGIACLAYHTAIKFALYQPLYPEFIVNYCFDIKRAAATFALFAFTLHDETMGYTRVGHVIHKAPDALWLCWSPLPRYGN